MQNTTPDFQISYGTNPTVSGTLTNPVTNQSYSGSVIYFTGKPDLAQSTAPIFTKSGTVNGNNQFSFPMQLADTTYDPGFYYYDFKLVDSSGNVIKKFPGQFQIVDSVSP